MHGATVRAVVGVVGFSLVTSTVHGADEFVRGDVDGNGSQQMADAIQIFGYLFLGSAEPRCKDAADVDDNGALELSDGIYLLNYLFLGGSAPPAPFPACGTDMTADALSCVVDPRCGGREEVHDVFDEGFVCLACPCNSWTVRNAVEEIHVEYVDLSRLGLTPAETETLGEELFNGRHLVRGFPYDDPEFCRGVTVTNFAVTELADSAGELYRLFDNGLRCFSWPCPSWTAIDETGTEKQVTDVDLRPLNLPPGEESRVREELLEGKWRVRSFIVRGPTGPAGLGTTAVVLELVERVEPPR